METLQRATQGEKDMQTRFTEERENLFRVRQHAFFFFFFLLLLLLLLTLSPSLSITHTHTHTHTHTLQNVREKEEALAKAQQELVAAQRTSHEHACMLSARIESLSACMQAKVLFDDTQRQAYNALNVAVGTEEIAARLADIIAEALHIVSEFAGLFSSYLSYLEERVRHAGAGAGLCVCVCVWYSSLSLSHTHTHTHAPSSVPGGPGCGERVLRGAE